MKPQVIHILAGLMAAGVLGLMFSNTRMVGVACTALLCYLFPIVALILAPVIPSVALWEHWNASCSLRWRT